MPGSTSPLGFPYPQPSDSLADLRGFMQELAEAVDDYLSALSAVAGTTWTDVTLGSGFSHLDAAAGLPGGVGERSQYIRRAGMVTLCLAQTKGTTVTALDVIASVPAGFRPSRPVRVQGENAGNFRGAVVMPAGDVLATNTWSSAIGIVGAITYAV